ncbi:MAG: hypothetical protein KJZ87_02545 [Thermoguttaceae bacterium]|nr:hypothetical protein [Thermoguttaceae bacterium]
MEDNHLIFGVHITDRYQKAPTVQELLTEYGCHIKTRIGLHQVDEKFCSPRGLIILEMFGDEAKCQELFDKLAAIEGVDVQKMVFEHPE